jgi:hypothetical protein
VGEHLDRLFPYALQRRALMLVVPSRNYLPKLNHRKHSKRCRPVGRRLNLECSRLGGGFHFYAMVREQILEHANRFETVHLNGGAIGGAQMLFEFRFG